MGSSTCYLEFLYVRYLCFLPVAIFPLLLIPTVQVAMYPEQMPVKLSAPITVRTAGCYLQSNIHARQTVILNAGLWLVTLWTTVLDAMK